MTQIEAMAKDIEIKRAKAIAAYEAAQALDFAGIPWAYSGYSWRAIVQARSMEEVHKMRGRLREAFGRWEDRLENVWYYCRPVASWVGLHAPVEIWLETTEEAFPAELHGEHCGFEDVVERRYVCRVPST